MTARTVSRLSERVQQVKPSATLGMLARAKAMAAAGEKVLSLAAGEPDFPTPPHICEAAVAAIHAGHTGYAPSAGIPLLRQAVRERYQRELGLAYDDDQVVVSCGAKHCLYNAMQSLLEPGCEAIIQAPYWVSYPDQVVLAGATPVLIPPRGDGFGLNLEQMSRAINPRTRLIVVNSPSNPTGHVVSGQDLDAVADLAIRHDLVVISDDIYDKLLYDGQRFESIVQRVPQMKERALLVNGVSKSYSMTGWRLGYAVGPKDIIAAMRNVQDQSTSNATTFVQYGAVQALASPPEVVDGMVRAFAKRRLRMGELLSALPGVRLTLPAGAFYAFPSFHEVVERSWNGQKIGTAHRLAEILLAQCKVAVIPGDAFGGPGYLRLSFAASMETIEEAIERIRGFVESLA